MPGSYPDGKKEIKKFIHENFNEDTKILDVGPGKGIYSELLNDKFKLDCVEIFPRYITDYNLEKLYNNIYISNILDFDYSEYELIIMGDVLEHIDLKPAQNLIKDITNKGIKTIVAVPYNYQQGPWEGNQYEAHLQPDLTHTNMNQRYPELKLIFDFKRYGYYTNF